MLARFSWLNGLLIVVAVFVAGSLIRRGMFAPPETTPEKPGFFFEDVTRQAGIDFQYQSPVLDPKIRGKMRLIFMGSGVAVADFNGDGWMDILLVNGGKGSKNKLYLNQQGKGFKDAAEEWGIADTNNEGATVDPVVFDYDNDGRPDVYLARLGCSMLFHNLGNRFENVTAKSGLGDCRNAISAVPVDYSNDGRLDLYVLRYWRDLDYFKLPVPTPFIWTENVVNSRNGGRNTLYRNMGDGRFEDVTDREGGADTGWSMAAGAADLAGDGTQRLYVANDFGADTVWAARDGKLANESAKLFEQPDRRWGMNVSFGDLGHDGLPHVFVTNETTPYYSAQHGNFLWKYEKGRLVDFAYEYGLQHCGGWPWGAAFADFDLDGREDLFVADGYITPKPGAGDYHFVMRSAAVIPGSLVDLPQWPDLDGKGISGGEVPCVFWNRGSQFVDVAHQTGVTASWDSRAVALIDFENNGTMDVIVTTQDGPPHLLKNTSTPGRHWATFTLVGTRSNRDGAGARIELRQTGQPPQYRWGTAGRTGFWASSDPRLHFGLPVEKPFDITVRWPSGTVDTHKGLEPGRNHVLKEGSATP